MGRSKGWREELWVREGKERGVIMEESGVLGESETLSGRPFHAKKSRQEVSSYLGSRFLPRILIQDKTFDVLQICIFRQLNYRFLCRFLNFFFLINSFLIILD